MRQATLLLQIFIVLLLVAVSQFYKLSAVPLQIWDESRLATNAYEMSQTGNLIVPTFENKPDMWNTKPPLMVWAQAASIKAFGLSPFSIRLPAALCGAMAMLLVAYIVFHITASTWAGVGAAIVLSTCIGFIGFHGSRFGEYDTMLSLFSTCYVFSFYLYVEAESSPKRRKYLLLFFACLTLAALTKGIAAFLFLPALFIYVVVRGKLLQTLSNPVLYGGLLAFVAVVAGYYLLRESYNPGYFATVIQNELGGRFSNTNEEHVGAWNFYIKLLIGQNYSVWIWTVPAAVVCAIATSNKPLKYALSYYLLCVVVFVVVMSASATKLPWYIHPIYPLLAVVAGLALFYIGSYISRYTQRVSRATIIGILVLMVSAYPVKQFYLFIKYNNYVDLSSNNFYALSYYLNDVRIGKKDLPHVMYLSTEYCPQWQVYIYMLQAKGHEIETEFLGINRVLVPNEYVLTNTTAAENDITEKYEAVVIDDFYGVKLYMIKGRK